MYTVSCSCHVSKCFSKWVIYVTAHSPHEKQHEEYVKLQLMIIFIAGSSAGCFLESLTNHLVYKMSASNENTHHKLWVIKILKHRKDQKQQIKKIKVVYINKWIISDLTVKFWVFHHSVQTGLRLTWSWLSPGYYLHETKLTWILLRMCPTVL